jgi:ApaG protein
MPERIVITPIPRFLPEHSNPEQGQYVFAYTITIENQGDQTAQLISRHWIITDDQQAVQEVRGLGVVGEQPVLPPGGSFTYTSGCTLHTPIGTMKGSYQFLNAEGGQFNASIPEFLLAVPSKLH